MSELREQERREDRAAVLHLIGTGALAIPLGIFFVVLGVGASLAGRGAGYPVWLPVVVALFGVWMLGSGIHSVRRGLALRRGRVALDAAQVRYDRLPPRVRTRARAEGWSPDPADRPAPAWVWVPPGVQIKTWHWVVAWAALLLLAVVPVFFLAVAMLFLTEGDWLGLLFLAAAGLAGWLVVAGARGYLGAWRELRERREAGSVDR